MLTVATWLHGTAPLAQGGSDEGNAAAKRPKGSGGSKQVRSSSSSSRST